MEITHVSPSYYPYSGGTETVVQEVGERLVKRGFEVDVLTQDPSGKYQPYEIVNGVTVRRFRTGPWGWDSRFSSRSLRSYLMENSHRYELIHAHGYHSFPALFAAWVKRGNKFVFSPYYHGTGRNLLRTLLLLPYHQIGKAIFERADKIICVSETERALVQKHFFVPDEKLIVIPTGVNQESIARAVPFAAKDKVILCVGRLEKYKNVQLAIRAMSYLPSQYKLIVIGNGSYKGKLEFLVEQLHLNDRVRIIPGLSNEEVYRWYQTCNLVLLLSSQEAFGIVAIEGLAAGKPVLVNNIDALAELAAKFKQVYPVAATTLSATQLAEEIARACGRKVEVPNLDQYSWDIIAAQMGNLYESLRSAK